MDDDAPARTYAAGAPAYAGTGLGYPMPINGKVAFLNGVTGRPGRITQPQVDGWVTAYPNHNLGLVLDWTVVGIDVDDGYLNHHGRTKHGAVTLAQRERELGTLPATITSTSRHDTHPRSRVHLFRVSPEDGRLLNTNLDFPPNPGDEFSDVEVLHHQYRYLAAWPSVHPDTGQPYRWYDREEQPLNSPPSVHELEDLPEAWVGYLVARCRSGNRDDYGYASRGEIDAALTDGPPHPDLAQIATRFWQDDIGHGSGGDTYGPDLLGLTRHLAETVATRGLPGSRAAVEVAYTGYTRGQWNTEKNRRAFRAAFSRSLKLWIEVAAEREQSAALEREFRQMLAGATQTDPARASTSSADLPDHDSDTGEVRDDAAADPVEGGKGPGYGLGGPAGSAIDIDGLNPAVQIAAPTRAEGAQAAATERYEEEVAAEMGRTRVRDEARRRIQEETAERVELPRLVRLTEFLDEPDLDPTWRVEHVWPTGGNIVLTAPAKSGKSHMVDNLMRSLADGEPFLGRYEPQPCRVLKLDAELDERTWRRWLRDQRIENTHRVHLSSLRGRLSTFNILDAAVRARWAEHIAAAEADVIVFDCLRPALDAIGLSEDKDAGRFLVALDQLKAESGISEALVVHHAGHNPTRSRGDSRIVDWPDASWKIIPKLDDDGNVDHAHPRDFWAFGRDVDVPNTLLNYDDDTRRMTLGDRSGAAADRADLAADVAAAVRAQPGVAKTALVNLLVGPGRGRDQVRRAVEDAVAAGRLYVQRGDNNSATLHPLGFA